MFFDIPYFWQNSCLTTRILISLKILTKSAILKGVWSFIMSFCRKLQIDIKIWQNPLQMTDFEPQTNNPEFWTEFDLIICNHVLEHINEDIKAMKEINVTRFIKIFIFIISYNNNFSKPNYLNKLNACQAECMLFITLILIFKKTITLIYILLAHLLEKYRKKQSNDLIIWPLSS